MFKMNVSVESSQLLVAKVKQNSAILKRMVAKKGVEMLTGS